VLLDVIAEISDSLKSSIVFDVGSHGARHVRVVLGRERENHATPLISRRLLQRSFVVRHSR
jgi:hypothetical protein